MFFGDVASVGLCLPLLSAKDEQPQLWSSFFLPNISVEFLINKIINCSSIILLAAGLKVFLALTNNSKPELHDSLESLEEPKSMLDVASVGPCLPL